MSESTAAVICPDSPAVANPVNVAALEAARDCEWRTGQPQSAPPTCRIEVQAALSRPGEAVAQSCEVALRVPLGHKPTKDGCRLGEARSDRQLGRWPGRSGGDRWLIASGASDVRRVAPATFGRVSLRARGFESSTGGRRSVPGVTRSGWERRCWPRAPRPSTRRRSSSRSGGSICRGTVAQSPSDSVSIVGGPTRARHHETDGCSDTTPAEPLRGRPHALRTLEPGLGDLDDLTAVIEGSVESSRAHWSELRIERFALLTMLPVKRMRAWNDLRLVVPTPPRPFGRGCVLVGRHCGHTRPRAVPSPWPRPG